MLEFAFYPYHTIPKLPSRADLFFLPLTAVCGTVACCSLINSNSLTPRQLQCHRSATLRNPGLFIYRPLEYQTPPLLLFLKRHFDLWKLVCVASLLRKASTSPYGTSNDDNLIRSASAITYAPVYESPTQQSWNDSKFKI